MKTIKINVSKECYLFLFPIFPTILKVMYIVIKYLTWKAVALTLLFIRIQSLSYFLVV